MDPAFVESLLPPDAGVRITDIAIEASAVVVRLTTTTVVARCPECGSPSTAVHGRYHRTLRAARASAYRFGSPSRPGGLTGPRAVVTVRALRPFDRVPATFFRRRRGPGRRPRGCRGGAGGRGRGRRTRRRPGRCRGRRCPPGGSPPGR